jgi:hypothetical protein
MKKIIILLILIISEIGCKPCNNATITDYLPASVLAYFDVFKPDNYWVYENQDKTKRDTVRVQILYITPYLYDYNNCKAYEDRTINFANSQIFNQGNSLNINSDSYSLSANARTISTQQFYNISKLEGPNLIINGTTYETPIVAKYSGNRIREVILCKRIGIIRTVIEQDTFNLVNYYIR